MSVSEFHLLMLFLKISQVCTLQCYQCSSREDIFCEHSPINMVTCQNSSGCVKLHVETFEFDRRVVYDKEREERDYESWDITPKYEIYAIVRKCSSIDEHYTRPDACVPIYDYSYNITVCMCSTDLCNDSIKSNLNHILLYIISSIIIIS